MRVESCGSSGPKVVVVPEPSECCTFVQIDSWVEKDHPKNCDTLYILSDGSGAYYWNSKDWVQISFGGGSSGNEVTKTEFEDYKKTQGTRDDGQEKRLEDLENAVPKTTQIRTTIGVDGITDSSIFNTDVISRADLLWTKQELPVGSLVTITGEFVLKSDQTASYSKIFWTTPAGFELEDVPVISGQFVDIMQYTELTNASLNALTEVNGEVGWSNYSSIKIGNYTISKTLRAKQNNSKNSEATTGA